MRDVEPLLKNCQEKKWMIKKWMKKDSEMGSNSEGP
jgi:hypothetical protein